MTKLGDSVSENIQTSSFVQEYISHKSLLNFSETIYTKLIFQSLLIMYQIITKYPVQS